MTPELLGGDLRALRRGRGLSIEELATRAGVSVRAISEIERGRTRRPHPSTMRRISGVLGVVQEMTHSQVSAVVDAASGLLSDGGSVGPYSPEARCQLPAATRLFAGRSRETAVLTAAATASESVGWLVIAAVDGMAGIGKSALAIHAAHQLKDRYGDGQLFVDLHAHSAGREPMSAADALETLLRSLEVPAQAIPPGVEARAALYRSRLAGTRTLVLLDNALDAAQVRPLLPGEAGCLVLITSRSRLTGLDDAHTLTLDVLDVDQAATLLRQVAGPQRIADDETEALAELAELCGRLPLALRIAGARLRHRPALRVADLVAQLRGATDRLVHLRDTERDVTAVFATSYARLPEAEQRLFRLLGLLPGDDIDACAAANLAGLGDVRTAEELLESLLDHNLLLQHQSGRYRLHDLVRAYARALAVQEAPGESGPAAARLLDYYQHTAWCAQALVTSTPRLPVEGPAPRVAPTLADRTAAWAWLRTERANLLSAFRQAATDDPLRAVRLAGATASLLATDGSWDEAITVHATAVGLAERLGQPAVLGAALTDLAYVRALTGDFTGAAADLHGAVDHCERAGAHLGHANALTLLAQISAFTGSRAPAERHLHHAIVRYARLDERLGLANAHTQRGTVHRLNGDYPAAARDLHAALAGYDALGDREGQATALSHLGVVHETTGDYSTATRYQQQALQLHRQAGNRIGQARAFLGLGQAYARAGDHLAAIDAGRRALELFRELADPNGQGNALGNLGYFKRLAGDPEDGLPDLQDALDIFRRIGARGNEAWALDLYAGTVAATGDHARALRLYRDVLDLARGTHMTAVEAAAHAGIGECYQHLGRIADSGTHLDQAFDMFQHLGLKSEAARVRANVDTRRTPGR
ncbi:ATP-binding protein [Streptacidiphilus jiangxiensis]|uniref:Tetratricopeptide repeat-containing protein n=1 Tax=Streptacidiphilus jiangxiensis TaxID=235985 RepID=A0A1H7TU48_STRJI|nr:helix-turn-helix domain-containing protein [Streptacidiphilus jiangxiensis]SEL88400.1 Tetratricopeptide repeat-containing protein [Streptacidiphilus jiangxiensis]